MTARQLTFDLPPRPAMGRDAFFLSGANAAAVALIDGWRDWPMGKLVLVGDAGSGKTHLAHVWAAQSGARILDAREAAARPLPDLMAELAAQPALALEDMAAIAGEGPAEEALFHLHNAVQEAGMPLLVTARAAPSRWGLRLPDLASRMAQATLARLEAPDDALLMVVMMKHAADRRLSLAPGVLQYLVRRIPRSFAAAGSVVARIDALALAEKRPPGMAHARAALAEITDAPSSS